MNGVLFLTWAAAPAEGESGEPLTDVYDVTLERQHHDGSWVVVAHDIVAAEQALVWTSEAAPGTYRALIGPSPDGRGEIVESDVVVLI